MLITKQNTIFIGLYYISLETSLSIETDIDQSAAPPRRHTYIVDTFLIFTFVKICFDIADYANKMYAE